jgi:hypothetical protein
MLCGTATTATITRPAEAFGCRSRQARRSPTPRGSRIPTNT